jgi:hypothetical protein
MTSMQAREQAAMAAGMAEQTTTTVAAEACSRVILSAHDGDRQQHNEDCNPPENRTIHLSNPPRTNTNLSTRRTL